MRERQFSVGQANTLVPRLQALIERLQRSALELRAERDAMARRLAVEPDRVPVERLLAERPGLRRVVEALDGAIEGIQALGVELKDAELGLIDFPAVIDGEPVYLCWQFGEDRVRFWHRRAEGFQGRRRLPGVPPAPEPQ
jgi:hypothetical protein